VATLSLGRCIVALIVLFATATAGKADMILWSYFSGAGPSNLFVTSGPGNTSSLLLLGSPHTNEHDAENVPVINMLSIGSHLDFHNMASTLNITLSDTAAFRSHTFNFPVVFNGSADGTTHTSSVIMSFTGSTTQSSDIGNNHYTVTMGPVKQLQWTSASSLGIAASLATIASVFPGNHTFTGEVDAQVKVGPTGAPAVTPEPSGLLLAAIGLLIAAGASLHTRRKGRARPLAA
jgi:hypothetical protein